MPHVIVKLAAGKSDAQKELTAAIVRETAGILDYGVDAVSVSLEELTATDWFEQVYEPDIRGKWSTLTKQPGYEPPLPFADRKD